MQGDGDLGLEIVEADDDADTGRSLSAVGKKDGRGGGGARVSIEVVSESDGMSSTLMVSESAIMRSPTTWPLQGLRETSPSHAMGDKVGLLGCCTG